MKPFKGRIALDIRDSTPDWEPYRAPQAPPGSPNVLMIAWDDLGYGTMEMFGGPVEAPAMRRIADVGVKFANFHTTALCSPTRASLLTGRNATTNGMATIAELGSGYPGISCRIPFENGFISEVLAERGWNIEVDRAQSLNLAAQEPERLAKLRDLWHYEAGRCNGLPLDDRTALEHILDERPHAAQPRSRYVYYPPEPTSPRKPERRSTGAPTRSSPAPSSTPMTPTASCTPMGASWAATACT